MTDFIFWLLTTYDSVNFCSLSVVSGNRSKSPSFANAFIKPLGKNQIFGILFCDTASNENTSFVERASSSATLYTPEEIS